MKEDQPEKEVTQPVRFIVPGYIFKRFTFLERLKVLIGHSIVLEIYLACQHNPGRMHPVSHLHVSPINDEHKAIKAVKDEAVKQKRIAVPEAKQ